MLLANYVVSVDLAEQEKEREHDVREEKQNDVKTSILSSVAVLPDDTAILVL